MLIISGNEVLSYYVTAIEERFIILKKLNRHENQKLRLYRSDFSEWNDLTIT